MSNLKKKIAYVNQKLLKKVMMIWPVTACFPQEEKIRSHLPKLAIRVYIQKKSSLAAKIRKIQKLKALIQAHPNNQDHPSYPNSQSLISLNISLKKKNQKPRLPLPHRNLMIKSQKLATPNNQKVRLGHLHLKPFLNKQSNSLLKSS